MAERRPQAAERKAQRCIAACDRSRFGNHCPPPVSRRARKDGRSETGQKDREASHANGLADRPTGGREASGGLSRASCRPAPVSR